LGKILTFAGMLESKEVTWFPSYGAEMRGGTANCTVIISDEIIGSPVVTSPDMLIAMNEASVDKFLPRLKEGGLFLFDSSLIREPHLRADVENVGVPAVGISSGIGNTKAANMVMLGAFIARTGLLHERSVTDAINSSMPERKKKVIEDNQKAILEGVRFIENKEG
jgi:2-oxoglutarate ferredoxin oxidoreductase subunit gamma